jgi:tRNA(Ile)-lysidine synthase TilS/MesJ
MNVPTIFQDINIDVISEYIFNGVKMTEDEYKFYIRQNELREELIPWEQGDDGYYSHFYDEHGEEFVIYKSFTTKDLKEKKIPSFRLH